MKFWLSPYELIRYHGPNKQGFLLKVTDNDFAEGFADISPFTRFGDPSVSEIPRLLSRGDLSSELLQKSVSQAIRDGRARESSVSLLKDNKLKNHFLLDHLNELSVDSVLLALSHGFEHIKIKVARNPEQELPFLLTIAEQVSKSCLRLDCNELANRHFIQTLEPIKEKIQFIEDPFSDLALWKSMDWPWAYDQPSFSLDKVKVDWQIIKPAKQNIFEQPADKKRVITSYMDHPVGIAHAFSEALSCELQGQIHGLMSFHLFENNPFYDYFFCDGPFLQFETGYGIGMDSVLKSCEWIEV